MNRFSPDQRQRHQHIAFIFVRLQYGITQQLLVSQLQKPVQKELRKTKYHAFLHYQLHKKKFASKANALKLIFMLMKHP